MGPISRLAAFFFLVIVASCTAQAQQVDAVDDPWEGFPALYVDRPLLPLDRGFRLVLEFESLATEKLLDDEGKVEDARGSINLFTALLTAEYGITDRFSIMLGIPYITGKIGRTSGGELGDLRIGAMVEAYYTDRADLALGVVVSAPTGNNAYHFEVLGDDAVLQNFRTGDPGYNFYPRVEAKNTYKSVSIKYGMAGIITGVGEVDFNFIPGPNEVVDADPGDGYNAWVELAWQATGWLAPFLVLDHRQVSQTKIDGEGLEDENSLTELQPGVLVHMPGEDADARLSVGVPLAGRNTVLAYPFLISVEGRF